MDALLDELPPPGDVEERRRAEDGRFPADKGAGPVAGLAGIGELGQPRPGLSLGLGQGEVRLARDLLEERFRHRLVEQVFLGIDPGHPEAHGQVAARLELLVLEVMFDGLARIRSVRSMASSTLSTP